MDYFTKELAHFVVIAVAMIAKLLIELWVTKTGFEPVKISFVLFTIFSSLSFGLIVGYVVYALTDDMIRSAVTVSIWIIIGVDGLIALKDLFKSNFKQTVQLYIDKKFK